jgi:hypothetical protein
MKSKILAAWQVTKNHTAFSLMLFAAGALGISSAQAVSVAPATYSIEFDGIPGAVSVFGATSPQVASYVFFGGTLDVNAGAGAIALPAVSAGVGSGGCTPISIPGGGCGGGVTLSRPRCVTKLQ